MNIIGKRYGKLVVIEKDNTRGDKNHSYLICQCDCGNIKSIRQDALRMGNTISCGCYAKKRASRQMIEQGLAGHNFEDLTGKRFDNLVVDGIYDKRYTKGGGYSIRYNCTCDCGAKVIVEGGNLRSGHTTSCGCKRESYIVKNIIKILNEMNINYRKEKVFDDLKSENNVYLRMDIYLPDYNTVIEIDGEQHFYKEPKSSIFTEEAIRKMKCNDKKKDDYCEEKGIIMVRIPYYEWRNVNKEYILNKIKAINI